MILALFAASALAVSSAVTMVTEDFGTLSALASTDTEGPVRNRFLQESGSAVRLQAYVITPGASGSKLTLQCSADNGATWVDAIGGGQPYAPIDAAGPQMTGMAPVTSACVWADRLWRVVAFDGNGVASPEIGAVRLEWW